MGRLGSRELVLPHQFSDCCSSKMTVLSRSVTVVSSEFSVAFLCFHVAFVIGLGAYVIGLVLSQISSFYFH